MIGRGGSQKRRALPRSRKSSARKPKLDARPITRLACFAGLAPLPGLPARGLWVDRVLTGTLRGIRPRDRAGGLSPRRSLFPRAISRLAVPSPPVPRGSQPELAASSRQNDPAAHEGSGRPRGDSFPDPLDPLPGRNGTASLASGLALRAARSLDGFRLTRRSPPPPPGRGPSRRRRHAGEWAPAIPGRPAGKPPTPAPAHGRRPQIRTRAQGVEARLATARKRELQRGRPQEAPR
jgi:hypothetical protein